MAEHTIEMTKSRCTDAYKYAADKSPESIHNLHWRSGEAGAEVDCRGNTLLHLIVMCGNAEALKALKQVVTKEDLMKQNMRGETVLHEAVRRGQDTIVKTLVEWCQELTPGSVPVTHSVMRNNVKFEVVVDELFAIKNRMGEIPLYVAAASGEKNVLQKLLDKSDCYTQREDGSTILHAAIMGEYYSMAFDIYGKYPELAHKADNRGNTPLNLLAMSPTAFRSGSMYGFEYLGRKPFIPLQMLVIILYYCIPRLYDFSKTGDPKPRKRSRIVQKFLKFPWFKPVDDTKQKHILAEELGKKLIAHETDWSYYSYAESMDEKSKKLIGKKKNNVSDPFIQAIEKSIHELVKEIITKYPDAANCIDDKGRNILHIAAEKKSTVIYELLRKYAVNRERMLVEVDFEGNTILHQTTNIAPTSDYISLGIFYSMCWNAYWYQKIKRDCSPHMRLLPNDKGETAQELYVKTTLTHRKEAGKVMNDINGNLMVVATLIGTVSFAALFTVPGSYSQTYGYPLNLESDRRGVQSFLGYDATTLFASAFALGMLLSIQISRFNVEDFYISLPLKYLSAISGMYYAACFCGVTVLQAFILEESWHSFVLVFVSFVAVILGLGFVDAVHYAFSYMVEIFWFSLRHTSQQR